MKLRIVLRSVSALMLIIAVAFLAVALSHPELGSVFYIGGLRIGSSVWRVFYLLYAASMLACFGASFFIKDKK